MPELKDLTREHRLRGCSRMRRAELNELIRNDPWNTNAPLQSWEPSITSGNQTAERGFSRASNRPPRPNRPPTPPQMSSLEPINDRLRPELEGPLTKRQLKRRRNKDSKLNKEFKRLETDIDNLKSQMYSLKDKITKASESTNARFKRKKIKSMKKEADKISEKLKESEAMLESVEQRVPIDLIRGAPFKLHPPNKNKCIEAEIAESNKKIRRAKNKKNEECLIAKREALKTETLRARLAESNWNPEFRLIDGAFDVAYRRYRIDGRPRMDVETFFNRIRRALIDLIRRELNSLYSARVQTTTWIRFVREDEESQERVELAFNSLMVNVYRGSNLFKIVNEMIANMKFQIDNPALLNSRFVFDEVLRLDANFYQLNLTRGSSYLPLPDWLVKKKMIISPHDEDEECFKWVVIAAKNVGMKDPQRVSNLRKFTDNYDWSGLKFPVSIENIKDFEMNNDISINVLSGENRDIYICRKEIRRMPG